MRAAFSQMPARCSSGAASRMVTLPIPARRRAKASAQPVCPPPMMATLWSMPGRSGTQLAGSGPIRRSAVRASASGSSDWLICLTSPHAASSSRHLGRSPCPRSIVASTSMTCVPPRNAVAKSGLRICRSWQRGWHCGRQQSQRVRAHQAAASRADGCVRPHHEHHAVRQAGIDADGDRTDRRGRPVLARRRTGAGEGRGAGEDPLHPCHRRHDRHGEDREGSRPRRWRTALVPALCVEQARVLLSADRPCASRGVRSADRNRRYHRAAQPRVQHAQRLPAAVHAEHDVHARYHAAPGVVHQRADEVLHQHRHAAQRELSR